MVGSGGSHHRRRRINHRHAANAVSWEIQVPTIRRHLQGTSERAGDRLDDPIRVGHPRPRLGRAGRRDRLGSPAVEAGWGALAVETGWGALAITTVAITTAVIMLMIGTAPAPPERHTASPPATTRRWPRSVHRCAPLRRCVRQGPGHLPDMGRRTTTTGNAEVRQLRVRDPRQPNPWLASRPRVARSRHGGDGPSEGRRPPRSAHLAELGRSRGVPLGVRRRDFRGQFVGLRVPAWAGRRMLGSPGLERVLRRRLGLNVKENPRHGERSSCGTPRHRGR